MLEESSQTLKVFSTESTLRGVDPLSTDTPSVVKKI